MPEAETSKEVIAAMQALLGDPGKLSDTLMHQARTLPAAEILDRIHFIVNQAAKAPPMPEDREHIAALRSRGSLFALVIYGTCVDHSVSVEEGSRDTRYAFGAPLQLHGKEHPIDDTDRWWI